ncbi:MAG: hydroxyacid dehydrogenase [Oscillospiraceae bacterium]
MNKTILIPTDISEPGKAYLRTRGYTLRMGRGTDEKTLMEDVAECDGLLARNESITASVIRAGKRLKVISKHGIGLDKIDLKAAQEAGIWVTFGPQSNIMSVAEQTLSLILACAKHTVSFDAAVRAGDYGIRERIKSTEICGKVLGLLGCGRIGGLVAKKAIYGLEMKVIAFDPYLRPENKDPDIAYVNDIATLFAKSDFISLHIPSTPQNRGIVDKKLFGVMKPSAFIINMARGDVVNEEDMVEALSENRIAGAGLDVFANEPPERDDPILRLQNVVVSPHSAALTRESADRMGLHAAMGIDEVLSGKVPTWPAVTPGHAK